MSRRRAKLFLAVVSAVLLSAITSGAQFVLPGAAAYPTEVQVPLSADIRITVVVHTLFGESSQTHAGKYWRSKDGRSRQDTSLGSIITDPKSRTIIHLNHSTKEAAVTQMPPAPKPLLPGSSPDVPRVQQAPPANAGENLGQKEVAGYMAQGTRKVTPADQVRLFGSIVTEAWTATELRLPVYIKQTSSRGYTIQTFENIRVGEPDASQFSIPEGYAVKQKAAASGLQPFGTPLSR